MKPARTILPVVVLAAALAGLPGVRPAHAQADGWDTDVEPGSVKVVSQDEIRAAALARKGASNMPVEPAAQKPAVLPVTSLSSPAQIASHDASDPGLTRWLQQRERDLASGKPAPRDSDSELHDLLSHSQLSAADLYQIGNKLAFLSVGSKETDPLAKARVIRPWCQRMVQQALAEAQKLDRGSPEAMNLAAMVMDWEHSVMWPLDEAKSLETGMNVYLRAYPETHAMIATARTSRAGALYRQGRSREALDEISALARDSTVKLSPPQRTEMEWIYGLVLFNERRHAEAIDHLKIAAEDSKYHHAADVLSLLILSQVRSNQVLDSTPYFRQLVDQHPEAPLTMQVGAERAAAIERLVQERTHRQPTSRGLYESGGDGKRPGGAGTDGTGGRSAMPATSGAIGVATQPSRASAASAPRINFDELARMSPDDRLKVAFGILEWRDAQLRTFSYSLTRQECFRALVPGAKVPRDEVKHEYTLKRDGPVNILTGQGYSEKEELTVVYSTRWDGKLQRTYTRFLSDKVGQGKVADQEFAAAGELNFNHMLGYRVRAGTVGLTEWLKSNMTRVTADVIDQDKGTPKIRIRFRAGGIQVQDFVLDPARDYMLVDYIADTSDKKDGYHGHATIEVIKAKQVDGLWVPLRVERWAYNNAVAEPTLESGTIEEVREFSLSPIDPDEFRVPFPVGAIVADAIRKVVYRLEPNGVVKAMPAVDMATGKDITPSDIDAAESFKAIGGYDSPAKDAATGDKGNGGK